MALPAKKMSLKERILAKKAAAAKEAAPVKKAGRPKKAEPAKTTPVKGPAVPQRGRPKGVKYVIPEKFQNQLEKGFAEYETSFDEFKNGLTKFVESGNKSAAKSARMALMSMTKMAKSLRGLIQDSKAALVQEPA